MTPKQTALYWREWAAVRKASGLAGTPVPDRHELHRRAFNGQDKSSKDFNTTTDLDAVIAVFRSISDPSNLNAQLRPVRQAEQRAVHARMNHVALLQALGIEHADAYLAAILRDRFKAKFISDLSQAPTYGKDQQRGPSQLMQYIYTVSGRIDALRRKKGWSLHDLYTRAGLECDCLACCKSRRVAEPILADSNHPF